MTDTRLGPTGRSFGTALEHIKAGGRARRAGWNGKGMWIAYGAGREVSHTALWNPQTKKFALSVGGVVEVLPYILFKTADDKILMGFLASQTDMLSEDWELLD